MFTRKGVLRGFPVYLAVGLLCVFAVPKARAMGWHQEIFVTVNKPVEIPGHVIGPGSYIFRLVSPSRTPYAVQIINRHTMRSVGFFLTLPTTRSRVTGKTVVKLQKSHSGQFVPQIKKWFYPGDKIGHEFIYTPAEQEFMSRLAQKTHSARG